MLLCSCVQFDDRTKELVQLLRRVIAVSFAPPQHHLDKAARDVDDQKPLRNTDAIATNLSGKLRLNQMIQAVFEIPQENFAFGLIKITATKVVENSSLQTLIRMVQENVAGQPGNRAGITIHTRITELLPTPLINPSLRKISDM